MTGLPSYSDMLHAPTTAHRRSESLDMARRARRLAQGLEDADRNRLLAYAEELEYEAASVEIASQEGRSVSDLGTMAEAP